MLKKLIFVFSFLALFLSGCNFSSGEIVSKKMDVGDFSKLSLELYGEVELVQGEMISVEIETAEKIIDSIELSVADDTLNIKTRRWLSSSDSLKIKISVPQITEIYATHNSIVNLKNYSGEELYLGLTENAKLNAENLQIDNLMCSLVQNSQVTLVGVAENFDLKLSNNVNFWAKDFKAKNISIQHNGVNTAELNAEEKLLGKIMSSGGIKKQGAAFVDIDFASSDEVGKVMDYEGNVLLQFCNSYSIDECPATCRVCPPCPECSSLLCQSAQACDNMGFGEGWLK